MPRTPKDHALSDTAAAWCSIALDVSMQLVEAAGPDLSQTELAVLLVIADAPGTGARELKHTLARVKSAITRALIKLEAMELIERLEDPDDRRLVRIYLTREGEQFLKQLAKTIAKAAARLA